MILVFSFSFRSDAAGWKSTNGKMQYYDDSGLVRSRWMYLNMNWYYFNKSGYMLTGLHKIKGRTYYFAPSSHGAWRVGMRTIGWQRVNGRYMYFNTMGEYIPNNKYESGSIKGIDVSQYQGSMDWSAAKRQGIKFTFIRVGHGNHNVDPYYQRNMIKAHAAGIKTGIYFYSTAKSESASRSDAKWVIDQMRGYTVNYPVALDMEDNSVAPLGKAKITKIAKAFLDEIRAAGYTPMIYCNENWATNFIDVDKLPGTYKWIARYNNIYNEAISRDIWQAGSTLLLDGIDVNSVDIDFCYRDFSKIVTSRTRAASTYYSKKKGFRKSSMGIWYDNGKGSYPRDRWVYINGKSYYFDDMGYIETGWKVLPYGTFYLGSDGARYENRWLDYGSERYYFNSDGRMARGWTRVGSNIYYMDESGHVQRGILRQSGKVYFLSGGGVLLLNRWIRYNGCDYYLTSNGSAATGPTSINGQTYYFDPSGRLMRNTTINGYTVDENGIVTEKSE